MRFEEAQRRIQSEPDFIYNKRFDFSLEKCLDRYPDGAPTKLIAQSLLMTEEDVEETTQRIVAKLQVIMKVNDE